MILVTGGAGYIGSHYVQYARARGEKLVVVDNLVFGHKEALPDDVKFIEGGMDDWTVTEFIFKNFDIEAVVHFAAFAYVGESVHDPKKYYDNNAFGTYQLLNQMRAYGVKNFVFSSTCATYGDPQYVPIDEKHPQNPINPYGNTKFLVERILKDYAHAYDFNFTALRYFNAAGADPKGHIGESHAPETHLIPLILQTAAGQRESVSIFGTDYDTPDGTCIRDYIHVLDLAQAHDLALQRLRQSKPSAVYNLGTEQGYSVREVIATCEEITGKSITVVESPRREGDPPRLVASAEKARTELGWKPEFQNLDEIVKTAWQWEQNRRY